MHAASFLLVKLWVSGILFYYISLDFFISFPISLYTIGLVAGIYRPAISGYLICSSHLLYSHIVWSHIIDFSMCPRSAHTDVTMQANPSYIAVEDGMELEPNPCYSAVQTASQYHGEDLWFRIIYSVYVYILHYIECSCTNWAKCCTGAHSCKLRLVTVIIIFLQLLLQQQCIYLI